MDESRRRHSRMLKEDASPKYELTDETKEWIGYTLHRIRALKNFSNVEEGDLGGWVESEDNLSQEGNCWVYDEAQVCSSAKVFDDAKVMDNAKVYGDAEVYGNAKVYGSARVFEDAKVFENAKVYDGSLVWGNAKVYGEAKVYEMTNISDYAEVYGNAEVFGEAYVFGDARVYGNSKVDYEISEGEINESRRHPRGRMLKEEREYYDERDEKILIDAGLNETERELISNFIWDVNKGKYRDLSSASVNYDGSVCVQSWSDGGFNDIPADKVLEFLRSNGVKESRILRGRMLKESRDVEELRDACISEGSLKPTDYIPKFLAVLKEYGPDTYDELVKREPLLLDPEQLEENDDNEAEWIIAELFDAMQTIAPEGCYFAGSEFDPACFGFWSEEQP